MKKLKNMNILIIGLGQIGGSIGLNLVKGRKVGHVAGYDMDRKASLLAARKKGVHSIAPTLAKGLAKADLVILAIPTGEIIKLLPEIERHVPDSSAILDVGSTKAEILRAVNRCHKRINFVGGHPLTGAEGYGFVSANPEIFSGAIFALIPAPETDKNWIRQIKYLVSALGAKPLMINAKNHDRLMAITSGLPYLISLSLMNLAITTAKREPVIWKLIAGSFRSATRVAVSSPKLTADLLFTNKNHIITALDKFIGELSARREIISQGNENSLIRLILKTYEAALNK